MPTPPLPVRDGLNPSRIRQPDTGPWETTLEYLIDRFPQDEARLREKVNAGEVVDESGAGIDIRTAFTPRRFVYLYRDPPTEPRVPFEIDVLHRDEDILVVDKPHFLASTPRGRFVVESALVRLRRDLDLPELSPAHRLDRVTAGLLLFTVHQGARRDYQTMFADRTVHKEYEAIARYDATVRTPMEVSSRIVKERGVLKAREVDGDPNSRSRLELIETAGGFGRYRLIPYTGKTHQLRLHMTSVGLPIHGDNFYPDFYDVAPEDYSNPLRLLSKVLEFTDPRTGERRRFESRRTLSWPIEHDGDRLPRELQEETK
ncbi:tRNA pseudouridine32 synthase/23S rRNA pseudouridine746 synthase [Rhodococcus sp. 27YEA15]|uniref:pseudouridine synthase n=1 Tax=Rhodococcus sp. 27YEA15 TaxID=3156259 RepID=UPI003C7E6030